MQPWSYLSLSLKVGELVQEETLVVELVRLDELQQVEQLVHLGCRTREGGKRWTQKGYKARKLSEANEDGKGYEKRKKKWSVCVPLTCEKMKRSIRAWGRPHEFVQAAWKPRKRGRQHQRCRRKNCRQILWKHACERRKTEHRDISNRYARTSRTPHED